MCLSSVSQPTLSGNDIEGLDKSTINPCFLMDQTLNELDLYSTLFVWQLEHELTYNSKHTDWSVPVGFDM